MQPVSGEVFVQHVPRHLLRGGDLREGFVFGRIKGVPDRFQTRDTVALQGAF